MIAFSAMALAAALSAYAPQQAGSAPLAPDLEARVQKLGKQLRCAVCQGLSVADSPASMARAQLDKVRELVAAGKSDEEVRAYFIERYGEWVLLEPPAHGTNLLVWLGPILLLAAGAYVVVRVMRTRPPPTETSSGAQPPAPRERAEPAPTPGSGDPYLDAVRSEVER